MSTNFDKFYGGWDVRLTTDFGGDPYHDADQGIFKSTARYAQLYEYCS